MGFYKIAAEEANAPHGDLPRSCDLDLKLGSPLHPMVKKFVTIPRDLFEDVCEEGGGRREGESSITSEDAPRTALGSGQRP